MALQVKSPMRLASASIVLFEHENDTIATKINEA